MLHDEQCPNTLTLSPKLSFVLGIVGGLLVFCTIGFFILLAIVLRGDVVPADNSAQDAAKTAAAEETTGAADLQAPEEQLGEIAPVTSSDHVTGNKNADVTLITYTDLECPYCANFHGTMKQVMDSYGDQIRWVIRHFPLSFHPNAVNAANAAECASEQGKFWEYVDKLFISQASYSDETYGKLATDLKLNKTKFDSCYQAKKYQDRIDGDRATGSTAGVSGTPATIILTEDGKKQLIPGALPFESVKQMLDSVL